MNLARVRSVNTTDMLWRIRTMRIGVLAKSCRTMLECCGAHRYSHPPPTKSSRPPHVCQSDEAFPGWVPGSSMARRDKASAWSAIYLL